MKIFSIAVIPIIIFSSRANLQWPHMHSFLYSKINQSSGWKIIDTPGSAVARNMEKIHAMVNLWFLQLVPMTVLTWLQIVFKIFQLYVVVSLIILLLDLLCHFAIPFLRARCKKDRRQHPASIFRPLKGLGLYFWSQKTRTFSLTRDPP